MAQMHERFCPNCGSTVAADQRFCSNCGANMDAAQPSHIPSPPTQYPQYQQQQPNQQYPQQQQQQQQQYRQAWQAPPANQPVPSYAQQPQQQGKQSPIVEAFAALGLLFLLRRSTRRAYTGRQRRSSGCCAFLTFVIIIGIIAAIGFAVYRSVGSSVRSLGSYNNSSGLTSQPPITTMQIGQSIPYAGVNITIVNVQQSKGFLDDPDTQTNGMVRLNIKEQSSASSGNYAYSEIARLILPDNTSVVPINEQQGTGPNAGVARNNWLDFPVPASDKISQLTLQLGKTTEAQITIPLTGKANLSQYRPKTSSPNVSTQYAGLTWTVTSATSALSMSGQQAAKGMIFVTVTLKVDNPSSTDFRGYWGDYIRLKSGGTTSSPTTDSNFPLSFPAGSAGMTGKLIFSMSQGSSSYTLIFLNTPSTNYSQATVNFQV